MTDPPCPTAKIAYPSPQAAHQTRRKAGHDGSAYQCPDCRMWHLTSARAEAK